MIFSRFRFGKFQGFLGFPGTKFQVIPDFLFSRSAGNPAFTRIVTLRSKNWEKSDSLKVLTTDAFKKKKRFNSEKMKKSFELDKHSYNLRKEETLKKENFKCCKIFKACLTIWGIMHIVIRNGKIVWKIV